MSDILTTWSLCRSLPLSLLVSLLYIYLSYLFTTRNKWPSPSSSNKWITGGDGGGGGGLCAEEDIHHRGKSAAVAADRQARSINPLSGCGDGCGCGFGTLMVIRWSPTTAAAKYICKVKAKGTLTILNAVQMLSLQYWTWWIFLAILDLCHQWNIKLT